MSNQVPDKMKENAVKLFDVFSAAYKGAIPLPPVATISQLVDQVGLAGNETVYALATLLKEGLIEIVRYTPPDVLEIMREKQPQKIPFAGAAVCGLCRGETLLLHPAGLQGIEYDDMLCANCIAETEFLLKNVFYQLTNKGIGYANAPKEGGQG